MKPKVVIDAGHGGKDPGAVGKRSNEKDHALAIAILVAKDLALNNVSSSLTRAEDSFISLNERSEISNSIGADVFVSVHMNSALNSATGTETLYMSASDLVLANNVHPLLVEATGFRDRGIKLQNVSVIRKTKAPAILCEVGFISNYNEETQLMSQEFRVKVAKSISKGIRNYLTSKGIYSDEVRLLSSSGDDMSSLLDHDGRYWVSARKWGHWFNLNVGWDEDTRSVLLDGKQMTTHLHEGTGFVLIRDVATSAGLQLKIDYNQRTVQLTKPETANGGERA